MEELKECPYCGYVPVGAGAESNIVWCTNKDCKNFSNHMERKFWQMRPIEKLLQDENAILSEALNISRLSVKDIQDKRDVLQSSVNTLTQNMQTAVSSYADMTNKRDALQKQLDSQMEISKKQGDDLQFKLENERKSNQHLLDAIKERLDMAEKALNGILELNTKLDSISLEQYTLATSTLNKIKG